MEVMPLKVTSMPQFLSQYFDIQTSEMDAKLASVNMGP
jgi:hypothetical protein